MPAQGRLVDPYLYLMRVFLFPRLLVAEILYCVNIIVSLYTNPWKHPRSQEELILHMYTS